MTEQANMVYRDIFGEEAPWTKGAPEERQAVFDKFLADADAAVIPDEDWERFHAHLLRNREPKDRPPRRNYFLEDEEETAA